MENALIFLDMKFEDLTRPNNLLNLLVPHSYEVPATFANRDYTAMKVGLRVEMIRSGIVYGFTMYLSTETSRES